MPMTRHLAALVLVLLAALPFAHLHAQDLPDFQSVTVNDLARVLTVEDARVIDAALRDLRQQTDVEGVVVTLADRRDHGGGDGLEGFATRLLNHWGVGDSLRDDGFMLLVLTENREARIELGAGYPPEADLIAQNIMQNTLLRQIRAGAMSPGIRDATLQIIAHLARPNAGGLPLVAPPDPGGGGWGWGWLAGITVVPILVFGFLGFVLLNIIRGIAARNRCPSCQHRPLFETAVPHRTALPDGSGWISDQNTITRECPACGWTETVLRDAPMASWYDQSGRLLRREAIHRSHGIASGGGARGSFGGGRSSGGGASGRW